MSFIWNDENTARAVKLAAEGLSASHIAKQVGAPSRSSVLGRLWRRGVQLESRANFFKTDTLKSRQEQIEARRLEVKRLYLDQNLSATETAKLIGVTEKSVRNIANKNGWTKSPEVIRQNAVKAGKLRWVNYVPKNPVVVKKSDAELIAEFLAKKKVTKLPEGIACGLTQWESRLVTAYPAQSFRQQNQAMYGKGHKSKAA